jgi:hypothetical protein
MIDAVVLRAVAAQKAEELHWRPLYTGVRHYQRAVSTLENAERMQHVQETWSAVILDVGWRIRVLR